MLYAKWNNVGLLKALKENFLMAPVLGEQLYMDSELKYYF